MTSDQDTPGIEGFPGTVGSAGDSQDSALQYVAFDILETGGEPDVQEDLLEPVEDELREHFDAVMRQAIGRAFCNSESGAARWALEELADRINYAGVPEAHRDEVRAAVEERLEQKHGQLAVRIDDVTHDARARVVEQTEDLVVDWGAVV